jgi:hypothetical protein
MHYVKIITGRLLPPLLLFQPLNSFAQLTCPSHAFLSTHAALSHIDYGKHSAILHFSIPHSPHAPLLTFRLPAQPPFARPKSEHYVSHSAAYDRGEVNWGFTAYYQQDFAQNLLKFIAYRDAFVSGSKVDCLYISMLEGYFLYGHVWLDIRTETN